MKTRCDIKVGDKVIFVGDPQFKDDIHYWDSEINQQLTFRNIKGKMFIINDTYYESNISYPISIRLNSTRLLVKHSEIVKVPDIIKIL